ncbi:DNA glycosylase [Testicularia cyperi]|uniref:DNA-(apurinic or apyrimidinic site) lyase n=1 Tax=Testicularia cyperi TaxID=1882483 RepID=A0A317XYD0_9BASI|nr:DNA glycosylase [Testicularia cyperi]
MPSWPSHIKSEIKEDDDDNVADLFGPRPPPGYCALKALPSQILLPLTVSNKCGQAFRWRSVEVPVSQSVASTSAKATTTEYSLCLSDRVVLLRQDTERGFLYHRTLLPATTTGTGTGTSTATSSPSHHIDTDTVNADTQRWLIDYLNLDVPLESLYQEWSEKDKVFARYAVRFSGLRMLRQDPWECLCAFICSSNNNIARIGQMVQNLCTHFSSPLLEYTYTTRLPLDPSKTGPPNEQTSASANAKELLDMKIVYHPFPSPETLAGEGVEHKLRELGFGYRAKYIARTAQMLCEAHSNAERMPFSERESRFDYGIRLEGGGSRPDTPASVCSSALLDGASGSESPRKRRRSAKCSASSISAQPGGEQSTPPPTAAPTFSSVRSYLESLRTKPYHDARQALTQFPGIGPKVADCILLMALDQPSAIPVDRHVFQFAEKWYGMRTKRYEEVAERLRRLWGGYAGWAHSVLFCADLRSFAGYGVPATATATATAAMLEDGVKTETNDGAKGEEVGFEAWDLGLPTPPASQDVKVEAMGFNESKSETKSGSSPFPSQNSLKPDPDATNAATGDTLAERIKSRPKRKSRLS